jgi:hypothetical protein
MVGHQELDYVNSDGFKLYSIDRSAQTSSVETLEFDNLAHPRSKYGVEIWIQKFASGVVIRKDS